MQDFPLNDDWAFARGAFGLAHGEGIHYSRWSSMPQLGQWLCARPFIEIFGESHAALRLSTIVLSLLGVLAFFDLLRQAGLAPPRAAFVSACLALNPLFFELSGTFLTDVPALAFSLVALALYGRAFSLASTNLLRAVDVLAFAVVVAVLRRDLAAEYDHGPHGGGPCFAGLSAAPFPSRVAPGRRHSRRRRRGRTLLAQIAP